MLPLVALLLTGLPENLEKAQAALEAGDVDKAYVQLLMYEPLASITRSNEEVTLARTAQAELERKQYFQASNLARFLIQLAPKSTFAMGVLGRCALEQGQIDEAQRWARSWAETDPSDPQRGVLEAAIDAKLGHWIEVSAKTASLMGDPRLTPAQRDEARDLNVRAGEVLEKNPAAAKEAKLQQASAVANRERELSAQNGKWAASDITLFCNTTSVDCDQVRDYFTQRSIPFVEKDIDVDEEAHALFVKETAGRAQKVPVTRFLTYPPAGYTVINGFKPQEFEQALRDKHPDWRTAHESKQP
ncbi:MAG: hypothetical protein JST54_24430 [Deltaproteobacteria bacterium]|nr:hypothetical protein [Deltaproteobacteria bacterium]